LDTRVCECCQTSVAMTAEGPVVVYGDCSEAEKEIRDISIVRLEGNNKLFRAPIEPPDRTPPGY